jgi:hypothetical protein
MTDRRMTRLALSLSLASAAGVGALVFGTPPLLRAAECDAFTDSDNDLLPDSLEWVTLTSPTDSDSDSNGTADFVQTVQHIAPMSGKSRPMQDEVRILVSSFRNGDADEVYLHMLFRFVGNQIGNVQSLVPFLAIGSNDPVVVPIGQLIGTGPVCVRSRFEEPLGTCLIISARIAAASELSWVLPCTVGAEAVIDGRRYTSGTYVSNTDGSQVALVPISTQSFIAQPLQGEGTTTPFWNSNSVCAMKLDVVGAGLAGMLCEVSSADCEIANGLKCAPSCRANVGRMVFVPDGLGTLTGG